MFLMLESLLSDIAPKAPREKEVKWLIRSLKEAHDRYDLSQFSALTPGSEGEDLHQDFATDARHKINHAKRQLTSDLPLDHTLRLTLEEKLGRLASVCLWLCQRHLRVHRVQGGVFSAYVKDRLSAAAKSASLILTEEEREMDLSATEIPIGSDSNSLWVTAQRDKRHENPSRFALFGTADRADLIKFKRIVRLISTLDGDRPWTAGHLDEPLDPSGLERLELVIGGHVRNRRVNRNDYGI